MPVHTKDLPGTTPNAPEEQSEQVAKVEKLDEKHADLLSNAAASGDPAVQDLLAHRAIAVQNADEDAVKEVDKKIADFFK